MTSDLFNLRDRVVLVTGASSGIGLHLSEMFAMAGAKVIAASRRAPESPDLAEIAARVDVSLLPVALDVIDEASVAAAVGVGIAAFGRIDVAINNAGLVTETAITDTPLADWDRVLGTNLTGAFLISRAVFAPMQAQGAGSIINISSIASVRAVNNTGAYSTSKGGLNQFTRNLAQEVARHGIRVNAILPGYVRTAMNAEFLDGEGGQKLAKSVPMRRVGHPGDLDGAVTFLASDASAYVTGTCIPVDGGYLL